MKRATPLRRGRPRRRSKADKERWESAWEPFCAVCDVEPTHTLHHVVYAQHVRDKHGDEWSPDDALPICRDCHDDHHSGSDWRIPVDALLERNRDFMADLLGEAAGDYLRRYYGSGVAA